MAWVSVVIVLKMRARDLSLCDQNQAKGGNIFKNILIIGFTTRDIFFVEQQSMRETRY